jgi:hypothetical protein
VLEVQLCYVIEELRQEYGDTDGNEICDQRRDGR